MSFLRQNKTDDEILDFEILNYLYNGKNENKIWVFREVRTYYKENFKNLNMMSFSVLEMIRFYSYNKIYDKNLKFLCYKLDTSKSNISYHVKKLIELKLVKKTEFGLTLTDNVFELKYGTKKKGSFVILHFKTWKALNLYYQKISKYYFTLERFAIISCIIILQESKYRRTSINTISKWLCLNRKTVSSSINKFIELNIAYKTKNKSIRIKKEFIETYFCKFMEEVYTNN